MTANGQCVANSAANEIAIQHSLTKPALALRTTAILVPLLYRPAIAGHQEE